MASQPGAGLLERLTPIREIRHAVVADSRGTLLESLGDADAETIGAVMGYAASTFNEIGATLGIGSLERLSFAGRDHSCIAAVVDEVVVAAFVEPTSSLAPVEKKILAALGMQ